jgi:hypothetical protein
MDATEMHLEVGGGASLYHGAPEVGAEDGNEFTMVLWRSTAQVV